MRAYKSIIIPSREKNVLDLVKCDLCGREAQTNWCSQTSSYYEIDETEVSVTVHHIKGVSREDDDEGTEYNADICPECFKTKLVPWLKSQGSQVDYKEWDW